MTTRTEPRVVSAIIPTKNEAANIGWVLDRLPAAVDEVIVVDGRSTDGTRAVAQARRPDVVLVLEEKPGKGAAVRAGLAAASGDIIVMLDADGSMNPDEIERFIACIEEGNDLAKGSRFMTGAGTADISLVRDLGNRVLLGIANVLFGTSRTDLCYGYAAFRRDAIRDLDLTADGFEIEAQLFLRAEGAGLRVAEVPSFEAPRRHGVSNLNTYRDGFRVLATIGLEWVRARRGLHKAQVRTTPATAAPVQLPVHERIDEGAITALPEPGPSGAAAAMWAPERPLGEETVIAWSRASKPTERRAAPPTPLHRGPARGRRMDVEPETSQALPR